MFELIAIFAAIFLGIQFCYVINLIIFYKSTRGTIVINEDMRDCLIQFDSDEDFAKSVTSKYVIFVNRRGKDD